MGQRHEAWRSLMAIQVIRDSNFNIQKTASGSLKDLPLGNMKSKMILYDNKT